MQSFNNFYRLAVMGVTLAIVVMGWRLYGPPAEKVKMIARQAIDQVSDWLRPDDEKPRGPAPPSVRPTGQVAAPLAPSSPPPLLSQESPSKVGPTTASSLPVAQTWPPATSQTSPTAVAPGGASASTEDDQIQSLIARLTALDVAEPQLMPWGGSGQLFRCCCRATRGPSPLSRHFESVAAEPAAAVEQVVAQIAAWRAAERQTR